MNSNSNLSDSFEELSSTSVNSFVSLPDALNANRSTDTNQTATKSTRYFSCTVCNIDLSNQRHLNSHLNSRQHLQAHSIYDVLQSVAPEYRPAYKAMFSPEMLDKKVFNRELRCEEEIKQSKKPLLGLNYVIEFQFENITDQVQYICELCHCKCSSSRSILSHILDTHHQRKFLNMHHPDMYDRVVSASNIRSEQQHLIENYARQIQSRHGGPGNVQLHIQLDSFIGQKPIVIAVIFKTQSAQHFTGQKQLTLQLTSKTFEEYDYIYDNEPIKENEEILTAPVVQIEEDSIQRGLSAEDLLYPFDRQFWYDNYKDLLQSRPIDPHSVTYQEIIPESNGMQPFSFQPENQPSLDSSSALTIVANENHLTLENGQTIRRNPSQPSNRRVILNTNRTSTVATNDILTTNSSKAPLKFDGYTLLNEQQKKNNGTHAVLNEQSARAILAASGLLKADEEDEHSMSLSYPLSMAPNDPTNLNLEQTVSPALAKRMLDAVLAGDLDVVHIQPYFSTFVNLIQTGQVELERHQAERLLHKVLVTSASSPTIKPESMPNNHKRIRSTSHSRERRLSSPHRSSSSHYYHHKDYHSSNNSNRNKNASTIRRVQLIPEHKSTNRE